MRPQEYVINGQKFVVEVVSSDGKNAEVRVNGVSYRVETPTAGAGGRVDPPPPAPLSPPPPQPAAAPRPAPPKASPAPTAASSENLVTSPMPGTILKVLVESGQEVKAGEALLILEAMKMENEIHAPRDGKVARLHVSAGAEVQSGSPLVELE